MSQHDKLVSCNLTSSVVNLRTFDSPALSGIIQVEFSFGFPSVGVTEARDVSVQEGCVLRFGFSNRVFEYPFEIRSFE